MKRAHEINLSILATVTGIYESVHQCVNVPERTYTPSSEGFYFFHFNPANPTSVPLEIPVYFHTLAAFHLTKHLGTYNLLIPGRGEWYGDKVPKIWVFLMRLSSFPEIEEMLFHVATKKCSRNSKQNFMLNGKCPVI